MNNSPLHLFHLSDLHFGSEDRDALDHVESLVAKMRPEAVLVSGDLTQRGRRSEFLAARTWFDRLEAPVLIAPGNHDTPLLQMHARIANPFRRYTKGLAGLDAIGRLVELGDGRIRIVALNTARGVQMRLNWADGVVDLRGLDTALDLLRGGRPDAWRFLLCHHPLVEPQQSPIRVSTRRGAEALRRVSDAGVHGVLTGHVHDAFAHPVGSGPGGTVQFGAGTLSTRLRASLPGFCILQVYPDRLIQEVVSIEGGASTLRRNYDSGGVSPSVAPG